MKYLNFLRERYFNDPKIDPSAQVDLAWAAYNAGPAKINRMRQQAAKRGFNPNKWFGHVETVTSEIVGREPVVYVANINKYYIAYKLLYETEMARRKAMGGIDGIDSTAVNPSAAASITDDSRQVTMPPAPEPGKKTKYKPKLSLKAATKKSSPRPTARYHTVRSGETLYSIGLRYGVDVDELVRRNRLDPKAPLHIRDKLRITP